TSEITQRLRSYELALRGVKGLMESSDQVTGREFHRYIEALQLPQTRPGLQGIALVMHVPAAQLDTFVARMQAHEQPSFQVRPEGERPVYAPLVFIEPLNQANAATRGVDLTTNPIARTAMARARDSDTLALSDGLRLAQDAPLGLAARPALVMYVPIYKPTLPTLTVAERQAALVGWVSGPFRVHELIEVLGHNLDADIHITVHQHTEPSARNLLYRSDEADAPRSTRQSTRLMSIGGNQVILLLTPKPAFVQRFATDEHATIALVGTAFSLLLGGMIWLLTTRREHAVALAQTMTQDLRRSEAAHESLLNALPDLLFEVDLEGRYISYRSSHPDMLAVPPQTFLGRRVSDVLPEPAATTCMAALKEAHIKGFSFGQEIEIQTPSGAQWFELSVARKTDSQPGQPLFVFLSRDVTTRKQAEQERALSAQVFNSARESTIITDEHNRIVAVNPAFTALTGYTAAEALGKTPSRLKSGLQATDFYAEMWDNIRTHGSWQGEVLNRRKDGTVYPEWLSINTVRDDNGHITQHIAVMSDLTAAKAAQQRIDHLAHYDALTGLPNSVLLHDRGDLAVASAHRKNAPLSLLVIDLDRFRKVNDSLGMPSGDVVLQTVAKRMVEHIHTDDTLSRHTGDEFTLLLPNTSATGAAHVASKLLGLLAQPFVLNEAPDQPLNLTASIGIAVFPDNATEFVPLLQAANAALHRAKQLSGNRFEFFKEDMHGAAREALLIESHLHRALAGNELVLHYQPQVDALSGRIIGAEALIRWQHPDWGLVPPFRFIPIAEKSGLIAEVGEWVLNTAVRQQAAWAAAGLDIVPVAINLSALEFRRDTLCSTVQAALAASGLPPAMLELELTESVAMEDTEFTVTQIQALHALGVKLSIDDFGTGYSSLSYLKRYQIDKLKIDQSFIRDIDNDVSDGAIVRTVISLAHGLGFKTIAEGVETAAQLDFLRRYRCDEIQGYYFSRPVVAESFADLLRNGTVLTGTDAGAT
ncbi:MAG: EAL domain-containing protein, partial [Hydrogenophaga sp.]|nr:EAL domain-containing protein [Hydrogenophaga sp.]